MLLEVKGGGMGGGEARGTKAPPIVDLHMRTLHVDNRLLRSLSSQPPPPNRISVPPPLVEIAVISSENKPYHVKC